jgi:23S rRNA pseudouridine2604 synthase
MPNLKGTRLNKFISQSGYCSRRQADVYIESGQVKLNGKKAKIGDLVFSGNKVMVNGFSLDIKDDVSPIFILLNKPVGITSTTEKGVKGNIVDFVNYPERIFPVGRLDKDSQGLIFLTNDGDIVNKILRSGNEHKKEYLVTVDKKLLDDDLDKMRRGIPILGTVTKKCTIQKEGQLVFRITLTQGLNRQIRRMCEYVGYQVKKLERVNIMGISSDGLKPGDWRNASGKEIQMIYSATQFSKSENDPKAPKSQVKKQNTRNSKKSKSNLKVKTKPPKFSRNHRGPSSKRRK